jgi:DNA primase
MKRGAALEIKSRLPILEFIEQYIQVERAGKNYRAKCPFHNEKTASFYISVERNTYYCFGCGKKGDIFSFLEEYEGLDFKHALVQLAEKAHIDLNEYDIGTGASDSKKDLYSVLEAATCFFEEVLKKNTIAKEYIQSRGVTEKTISTFRLGFAPADWKELYLHLKSKKFSDELINEAGLIKKGDYGYYDRFRNRIMFPFMDTSGRVIGFSGRIIDPQSKEAKYINSPESPLFNKSEIFYGLYQAKDAIRRGKRVIVVEGQMDVIMTHQSGVAYVVASSGTAFSGNDTSKEGVSSHLGVIKRLTDSIYFAFDNDSAGLKAMYRATLTALGVGFYVYCIPITGKKDFADIALNNPKELQSLISVKQDAILFFTYYLKTHSSTQVLNKGISQKIWPLLGAVVSPIEQSHYVNQIASMLSIDERALYDDFRLYQKKSQQSSNHHESQSQISKSIPIQEDALKKIFGLIFYFEENSLIEYAQVYIEKLKTLLHTRYEEMRDTYEIQKDALLFLIEKTFIDQKTLVADALFLYTIYEQQYYKQQIDSLKQEIAQDELLGIDTQEKIKQVAGITRKMQIK